MQFANKTCQPYLKYRIGDKMYMDARHFASEKDKKLLDLKNAGLWKIIPNINNKIYKLDIFKILKDAGLTPIFHPWKMHFTLDNAFSGQILPPDPPVKISAKNDDNHKAYKE